MAPILDAAELAVTLRRTRAGHLQTLRAALTDVDMLYLPEIFKGLGYSASKMKLDSYAFEYPEEQWYPPDSYRGRPVLVEEQGRPRCVACGLCARSCPPLAISMQAHEVAAWHAAPFRGRP